MAQSQSEILLSRTIYEDGEDGSTSRWTVYGPGEVLNIPDSAGNRIIATRGNPNDSSFRLGLEDKGDWDNSKEFSSYFSILMGEGDAIYFRVDTSKGEYYLCYHLGPKNNSVEDNIVYLGLGFEADVQWHSVHLDLEEDLRKVDPDNRLLTIKDFYVHGSVNLDDLMLFKYSEE